MKHRNNKLLSLCIAMALSGTTTPVFAASQNDVSQLLNQGHFWYEQGRADFSEDSWNKVLLIDPSNVEAQRGLQEIQSNNVDGINKSALAQARSAASNAEHQQALEFYRQAFASYGGKPPTSYLAAEYNLTLAGTEKGWQKAQRELAQLVKQYPSSNRYLYSLAAAQTYQEATRIAGIKTLHRLRSSENIGALATKSWRAATQWLTASDDNWDTIHSELSNLQRSYPNVNEYLLPLAKIKTYRQHTRREGINMLASLSANAKYSSEALPAWRQALLWLNTNYLDRHLYTTFLDRSPDDTEVQSKMYQLPAAPPSEDEIRLAAEQAQQEQKRRQRDQARAARVKAEAVRGRARAAHGRQITEGYELLNQQLPDSAILQFETLLDKNGSDAEALKGLGIAHMRLQNFSEAKRYLTLAIEADPAANGHLQSELNEVQFWSVQTDAEWAYKQGEIEKALDLAQQADQLRPNHPETLLLLARLSAGRSDNDSSRIYYEQVLSLQPQNTEAQEGLAGALSGLGLLDEAGRTIHKYNLRDDEYLAYRNMVEAAALRAEATETNNNDTAIRLLTRAQRLQQQDPWIRLDLAKRYRLAGRPKVAISLLDQLIGMYPDYPDAYHAKALYHAQFNELFEGLVALESIPEAYRNQRQASLYRDVYRQLWIKQKKLEADQLIAIGDFAAVNEIIETMKVVEQADPFAMLIRAELLADVGKTGEAINIVNQVKNFSTNDDVTFKTQLATVLLKARERDALELILGQLKAQEPSMNFAQRDDVQKLRLGMSLQKADDLRKAGRYQDAISTLDPMQERFGKDLGLKLSRATIYKESKQYKLAQDIYREILIADPNYRAAYAGSAGSFMDQARYPAARKVIDKGLRTVLEAPELLALRGKLKLLAGDYNGAAQDLQQSLFDDYDNRTYNLQGGSGGGSGEPDALPGSWQYEARKDLRRLNNRKLSNTLFGLGGRSRDGDGGLNQLTEVSLPILFKNYRDYENSSGLGVRPVLLDAGTLRPDNGDANRFGALVLARESDDARERDPVINKSFNFQESGVALTGFIKGRNYKLDLGVTPVGFKINTVLGGLHWFHKGYQSKYGARITRRAVKDSIVSYAGVKDPDTNQEWGAVAKSGLDLNFSYGLDRMGVYGNIGAHIYDGQSVADNESAEAKLGLYYTLFDTGRSKLTTGINGRYAAFDKNLNFFTLGHGGYFSPQDYVNVSIPIEYQASNGGFHYRIGADIGQQDFNTDAIDVFPIDTPLQDRLEEIQSTINSAVRTTYDAESVSEAVFNIRGEIEYAISDSLAFGGWANATSVDDFEEFKAGIYLRRYTLPKTDSKPLFRDDVEDHFHEFW
ncbi:MAG TPA: hypothetical protein DD827_06370 [Gammaproteobacteria bacterium]|nr:hypothetical protein [Gammaproteobacteria bacterium]